MKGLASVLLVLVLTGMAAIAGPLELGFGVGPSFTSLDSFNESISVFNALKARSLPCQRWAEGCTCLQLRSIG